MIRNFVLFALVVFLSAAAQAQESAIQTQAKQVIVVDYHTGAVLMEKNADERMPTSSMSKTLTAYVIFDALKQGRIKMDQEFSISEKSWKMQGSKMFVDVGKTAKVEDLLRGVIVQSGNDASIALAEGLTGSEEAFSGLLNEKARELGMANSHFMDASGWPHEDHYSTARDLAIMTRALIRDYPEYYPMFAEKEFTYNNIKQHNRNPLLYKNVGADGVKTGHTEAAGYGLIGSGVYGGRRVIIVANGLPDEKTRAEETAALLDWGMKNFENIDILKSGSAVESAAVFLGTSPSVPLIVKDDLTVTLPKASAKNYKVTASFQEPVQAPVKEGQELGSLSIEIPHGESIKVPLYAGKSVDRLGFIAGAAAKAKLLLGGG